MKPSERLAFYYAMKPMMVSQSWGIYNPAYQQFGYSKHNGTDFKIGTDKKLWWPVKNCTVYYSDFGKYTGWCIKANTNDKYLFPDGKICRVNLILMHLEEKSPLTVGQIVDVGTYSGIPDNTGFSTGPHTHIMGRRIDDEGNLIDNNDADNSFDLMEYATGYYAQDYGVLISYYTTLVGVLQKIISQLKK
jgi:hypothetical protein